MIAALVRVELHVPASSSLKAKRGVIKSLIAQLRRELNVSVAEVGYQEKWQRCVLAVAAVGGSEVGVRKVAQQVGKVVDREPRVEVIAIDVDVVEAEH